MLARPVTVKILRPELAGDPEALARFRHEARYGASLAVAQSRVLAAVPGRCAR
jgi:hypothetical protein